MEQSAIVNITKLKQEYDILIKIIINHNNNNNINNINNNNNNNRKMGRFHNS